ncbi:MAG: N-acetylglucosamine kinase [Pseudarcicella sp.]|nr:N-acetylglucosamine kinase [Pseudarcicella sp.]
MILIADSGSTKTDWRLVSSDGTVSQMKTLGINPYYQSKEQIIEVIANVVSQVIVAEIKGVFFYGAGLAGLEKKSLMQEILFDFFPFSNNVEVFDDMTAAARSLLGTQSGIACILGTGANTCFYDGQNIAFQIPSLGFWLGDEGSGAYFGKILVQKYLHKELPDDIIERFEKRFGKKDRLEILDNAYQKPLPNRYFAGFSKFLFDNRQHPYIYMLVADGFQLFFEKYINKYPDFKTYKVSFTGSVAFYYSDILRKIASNNGVTVGVIMETPIAGLTLFHQQSMNI